MDMSGKEVLGFWGVGFGGVGFGVRVLGYLWFLGVGRFWVSGCGLLHVCFNGRVRFGWAGVLWVSGSKTFGCHRIYDFGFRVWGDASGFRATECLLPMTQGAQTLTSAPGKLFPETPISLNSGIYLKFL